MRKEHGGIGLELNHFFGDDLAKSLALENVAVGKLSCKNNADMVRLYTRLKPDAHNWDVNLHDPKPADEIYAPILAVSIILFLLFVITLVNLHLT